MSLPFRSRLAALAAAGLLLTAAEPSPRVLRVCADPNNLPFSNRQEAGFENRIATLVASDLHATLEYTWWAQRRGFIRNTLGARRCDLVIGIPADDDMVAPHIRITPRPTIRLAPLGQPEAPLAGRPSASATAHRHPLHRRRLPQYAARTSPGAAWYRAQRRRLQHLRGLCEAESASRNHRRRGSG